MSEEAKKTIETVKQGKLPPLTTPNDRGKQSSSNITKPNSTKTSQHGIDHSRFGLQYLNENAQNIKKKKD